MPVLSEAKIVVDDFEVDFCGDEGGDESVSEHENENEMP